MTSPTVQMNLSLGGDPHFIGFDGEKFEFHGKKDSYYLLYEDEELKIIALFGEPDLNFAPHLEGSTFIKSLGVNGREITPDILPRSTEQEILEKTGFVRGLHEELNFICGAVIGMEVIKFPNCDLVITSMESAGLHLNLSFRFHSFDFKATGIIGQTYLPKEQRRLNEEFRL